MREFENIVNGVGFVFVVVEMVVIEGWIEGCVVNCDNCFEFDVVVLVVDNLFVIEVFSV